MSRRWAAAAVAAAIGAVILGPAVVTSARAARAPEGSPPALPARIGPAPPANPAPTPFPRRPPPPPVAPARSAGPLAAEVTALVADSGGTVSVVFAEVGGGLSWSLAGDRAFPAASTYKLPALMAEADAVARGLRSTGPVCYQDSDAEDGWFGDYQEGACYSRSELAFRAGIDSDNTAGHMLVRDLGGTSALAAFAATHGATASSFFDPNTATAHDLTALWLAEARGEMGGPAAQAWLFPFLTHTQFESGIPAGVPATATVVHKVGALDDVENDAALIAGGARPYVLTVLTAGLGGDAGWALIAAISKRAWAFENPGG